MEITLNIKDDKNLRNYMKDYLKGLVTSISREEVEQQIIDAATKKISNLSDRDIKSMINIDPDEKFRLIREKIDTFTTDDFNRGVEARVTEIHINANRYATQRMEEEMTKIKKEMFSKLFDAPKG